MAHPKRSQTTTGDNSAKDEVQLRKPGTPGSRGAPPSSPLLGNANNPNKADIPDRRKGATTGPSVSCWGDELPLWYGPCTVDLNSSWVLGSWTPPGDSIAFIKGFCVWLKCFSSLFTLQNNSASAGMTRRNTYVCSDRNNTDRLSVIPNGKENRWEFDPESGHLRVSFFFLSTREFFRLVFFSFLLILFCRSEYSVYFFCFVLFPLVWAWAAWLRWLVTLVPLLPLRPLCSVPRPVRCSGGIKLLALCTLVRQAGPYCPTPTTLWTTARPSKMAGPPNPTCLYRVSALIWPLPNLHMQPASHSVTPQLKASHPPENCRVVGFWSNLCSCWAKSR